MSSTLDSALLCPSCEGKNALDSKFCRYCGHSLEDAQTVAAATTVVADEIVAAEPNMVPIAIPAVVPLVVFGANEPVLEAETLSSPAEIDARHARQLLERAQGLSERGDTAGAVLACRQALHLAPTLPGAHAMLGALLERTGDMNGAIAALARAATLAPESSAPRDLSRLQEKLAPKNEALFFSFNEAEHYSDVSSSAPGTETLSVPATFVTPPTETPGATAPGAAATEAAASLDATAVAALIENSALAQPEIELQTTAVPVVIAKDDAPVEPILLATPEAALLADAAIETPNPTAVPIIVPGVAGDAVADMTIPVVVAALPVADAVVPERRVAAVPVRVERRVASVATPPRAVVGVPIGKPFGTPIGARVNVPANAGVPVVSPLSLGNIDSGPQGWNALWARPSYFGRSLPLVGATILALGFLGWARGLADARNLASAPVVVVAANPEVPAPVGLTPPVTAPVETSALPPLAPVGSPAVSNGGFPISNQVAPAPSTPNVATQIARNTPRTATVSRPATRPANRNAPPPQLLAPAPIPNSGNSSGNGNSGGLILPPPTIDSPPPSAPATSVLPPSNTPPLNPAGAGARGYVRITQGRFGATVPPQRSSSLANNAERNAAAAARNGSTGQAIDGLTSAINSNSSDAGFRFQQRAILFLGQGNYSQAAEDFQSAISAYSDQIARGDQVASARAGLSASRSGLNRALAGGR